MKRKIALRIASLRYHNALVWMAAAALLLFGLSGLMHPVMLWTGPRPAAFFPPQASLQAAHVSAVSEILKAHEIDAPLLVKLVPANGEVLLQITEQHDQPRRYFSPQTREELKGYDEQHAVSLARYYSGLADAEIESVDFQTVFNNAYPWVNRLLPVYRITFATPDHITVYVHTELNAMAGMTNDWKTSLQTVFGLFHTWNFLDDIEALRVTAMSLLVVSLFIMTVMGMVLIFTLAKRPNSSRSRSLHRWMSYVLWLPLLGFTASGSYHLWQYSLVDQSRGLRHGERLSIAEADVAPQADWVARYDGQSFNAVSLVADEEGGLHYRLAVPPVQQSMPSHHQRFDGVATEKSAYYVNAATGQDSALTDKAMAESIARQFLPDGEVVHVYEITGFSPAYDFRNKRLPAWGVDFASGDTLFIDPASGALVDRVSTAQKAEGVVFSQAHKWNFIGDMIGRMPRDVLVVLVLLSCLAMTVFGIVLKLRRR